MEKGSPADPSGGFLLNSVETAWAISSLAVIVLCATSASAVAGTKAEAKADYDLVCNAVARSGADKVKDPGERAQRIATFLQRWVDYERGSTTDYHFAIIPM